MRVLVTGAGGQLGREVVADLERRAGAIVRGPSLEVVAAAHARLDVTSRDAVLAALIGLEPDVVIHTAAFTAVDACEAEPDRAFATNALGTRHLQEAARLVGAHLCFLSTDYVFDGTAPEPYREWDRPNPLSVYGRSKLGGEGECEPGSTIVRTSWVCGRHGANMVKTILRLAADPQAKLRFVDDQRGSPTIAADLARRVCDLALARRPGLFHLTNAGATTWSGFARAVVAFSGGDPDRVEPIATAELDPPRPAPRPANSVLDNAVLRLAGEAPLPPWEASTEALVAELTR